MRHVTVISAKGGGLVRVKHVTMMSAKGGGLVRVKHVTMTCQLRGAC